LFIWWMRNRPLPRSYLYTLGGGTVITLLFFATPRILVTHQTVTLVPLWCFFRNLVMSTGAVILPLDSVLANTLFGTPLPSELKISPSLQYLLLGSGLAVLAVATLLAARSATFRQKLALTEWPKILLLAVGSIFALVPILAFTAHPSETYLYLPSALYALALSVLMKRVVGDRRFMFATGVVLFSILFGSATWIRNGRVADCGAIAQKIITGLPIHEWSQGEWCVKLASFPWDLPSPRYGLYQYRGLSTIDPREPGMRAAEWALQIATGNDKVKAEVVDATMVENCAWHGECFFVAGDGSITRAGPARE
ncbi:MAG: hypothetical protein ABFD86_12410, partial [Bryobacteraceae bacterium]